MLNRSNYVASVMEGGSFLFLWETRSNENANCDIPVYLMLYYGIKIILTNVSFFDLIHLPLNIWPTWEANCNKPYSFIFINTILLWI